MHRGSTREKEKSLAAGLRPSGRDDDIGHSG